MVANIEKFLILFQVTFWGKCKNNNGGGGHIQDTHKGIHIICECAKKFIHTHLGNHAHLWTRPLPPQRWTYCITSMRREGTVTTLIQRNACGWDMQWSPAFADSALILLQTDMYKLYQPHYSRCIQISNHYSHWSRSNTFQHGSQKLAVCYSTRVARISLCMLVMQ
jgi:hypothetical protein